MKHYFKKIISTLLLVAILAVTDQPLVQKTFFASEPEAETCSDLDKEKFEY